MERFQTMMINKLPSQVETIIDEEQGDLNQEILKIDIARPLLFIKEMNFLDYNSESCLENLELIQQNESIEKLRQQLGFLSPQDKGDSLESLLGNIKRIIEFLGDGEKDEFQQFIDSRDESFKSTNFVSKENGLQMFTAIAFHFYFNNKVEIFIDKILKIEKIINDFDDEKEDSEQELMETQMIKMYPDPKSTQIIQKIAKEPQTQQILLKLQDDEEKRQSEILKLKQMEKIRIEIKMKFYQIFVKDKKKQVEIFYDNEEVYETVCISEILKQEKQKSDVLMNLKQSDEKQQNFGTILNLKSLKEQEENFQTSLIQRYEGKGNECDQFESNQDESQNLGTAIIQVKSQNFDVQKKNNKEKEIILDSQNYKDEYKRIRQQFQKELNEIDFWISKSLPELNSFVGECTMSMCIDQNEISYYQQPGNVFTWLKIIAAQIKQTNQNFSQKKAVFHIFGYTCKQIIGYQDDNNVLFDKGCEFLVCKSQIIDDIYHFWLREIQTGYGANVVLWIDDNLFPDELSELNLKIQQNLMYLQHLTLNQNIKFVLKSSTEVARAYVKSNFFKLSLQHCFTFKIISDIARLNERNKEDICDAGPKFIKELKEIIKNWQFISKIQYLIFSSQKQKAYKALQKFGMKEDQEDMPKVADKDEEILNFLKNSF